MVNDKVKVLYIAGWGRSGSTILGNILGQIDGFTYAGELCYIWERGLIENWLCGCGDPFRDCKVWKARFSDAYGGMNQIDPQEMIRLRQAGTRTRHIPLMMSSWGQTFLNSRLERYLNNLATLYQGIQSSSKVIVDSSKYPSYGYILGMIPTIKLYIVHLVRDSRGTAFSWLRKKHDPGSKDKSLMDIHGPIKSSLFWLILNLASEKLWKTSAEKHSYMQVRYEDFAAHPRKVTANIVKFIRENPCRLPFLDEHRVEINPTHTISGNPVRLKQGTIEIQPDLRWQSEMKLRHKTLVTLLTWPLLMRYQYLTDSTPDVHE